MITAKAKRGASPERTEAVDQMSKRKYRRGCRITSLDELTRQDIVFLRDKPTAKGWFLSWQFRMAVNAVDGGDIFYAMPASASTRLTDEEIIWAERRLHTKPTLEGRTELIRILNEYDRGTSDGDAEGREEGSNDQEGSNKGHQ